MEQTRVQHTTMLSYTVMLTLSMLTLNTVESKADCFLIYGAETT